ncbi:hypothetical protein [Actinomadura madurae]|nr:hypothetical protein [Actinomadura madurae]
MVSTRTTDVGRSGPPAMPTIVVPSVDSCVAQFRYGTSTSTRSSVSVS